MSTAEFNAKLEAWFADAKKRLSNQVNDHISRAFREAIEAELQGKVGRLEAKLLERFGSVADVNQLEDRAQDLEEVKKRLLARFAELNEDVRRLRSEIDEVASENPKLDANGEVLNICSRAARSTSSETNVRRLVQPPTSTQQRPSGGLLERIAPRGGSPPLDQRNGGRTVSESFSLTRTGTEGE